MYMSNGRGRLDLKNDILAMTSRDAIKYSRTYVQVLTG